MNEPITSAKKRSRLPLAMALVIVIGVGIFTRTPAGRLPWFDKEVGDVLWGTMFYLLILLAKPTIRTWGAVVIAFLICSAIEFFKLVHTPWIDALRAGPVGFLLGHTFYWHNFPCYLLGAFLGAMLR